MKYFKKSEFKCRCGCGANNISAELIAKLNEARGLAGIPFHINSGTRCFKHNRGVGGKPTSSHLKGLAADIRYSNSNERYVIINTLLEAGFKRIGVGRHFVHVDIDKTKVQKVLWTY